MSDKSAVERVVEWARLEMSGHQEHCDCDLCAAFYDLDYPSQALRTAAASKDAELAKWKAEAVKLAFAIRTEGPHGNLCECLVPGSPCYAEHGPYCGCDCWIKKALSSSPQSTAFAERVAKLEAVLKSAQVFLSGINKQMTPGQKVNVIDGRELLKTFVDVVAEAERAKGGERG